MAQVDYFLKIDGIPGDSMDKTHKDEIEIDSFSWGVSNTAPVGGGGGAGGKAQFQDFHFSSSISKASPKLFIGCATGQHFPAAQLTARKAGETQLEFLKIKLSDVLVSSYQASGSGGISPTDSVAINFAKIEVFFSTQKPNGLIGETISAGFDLKKNAKV